MNEIALLAHFKDTVLVTSERKAYFEEQAETLRATVSFCQDAPDLWCWQTLTLSSGDSYNRNISATKRERCQSVYFIQAESVGLIKIGITESIEYRLKTLQQMSPDNLVLLGLMHGGVQKEKELHRRFSSSRAHGEWFYPTKELLSYIQSHSYSY